MKKISTLFKKDPNDLGRVINEINPENEWVFDNGVIATQKYDGTACAIIHGELYKRYDVKTGKQVPETAIPCQEPDSVTGHWPHWVKCSRDDNSNKWHFEAFDKLREEQKKEDYMTFELCGPKIQGNPERLDGHYLMRHGNMTFINYGKITFEDIEGLLTNQNIEGLVFHHPDGRMCKIRKSDFGVKR